MKLLATLIMPIILLKVLLQGLWSGLCETTSYIKYHSVREYKSYLKIIKD